MKPPRSPPRSRLDSTSRREAKRGKSTNQGRDESLFALKIKRNLDVTIVKYILSLFGQTLSLFGQTIYPGLRTLCPTPRLSPAQSFRQENCWRFSSTKERAVIREKMRPHKTQNYHNNCKDRSRRKMDPCKLS
jgi:hypothetical protein